MGRILNIKLTWRERLSNWWFETRCFFAEWRARRAYRRFARHVRTYRRPTSAVILLTGICDSGGAGLCRPAWGRCALAPLAELTMN